MGKPIIIPKPEPAPGSIEAEIRALAKAVVSSAGFGGTRFHLDEVLRQFSEIVAAHGKPDKDNLPSAVNGLNETAKAFLAWLKERDTVPAGVDQRAAKLQKALDKLDAQVPDKK